MGWVVLVGQGDVHGDNDYLNEARKQVGVLWKCLLTKIWVGLLQGVV